MDIELTALRGSESVTETRVALDRLEHLFEAHQGRLFALARRLTRGREDALDLVQETFLRAARRPASVPAGTAAEPWLVRTLVNVCRDRWRRDEVRSRPIPEVRFEVAPPSSPESQVVARTTVEAALARLSPRRRAVVVLFELEGRDVKEIAGLLGVAAVTVRWHLSRARKQLSALLTEGESA